MSLVLGKIHYLVFNKILWFEGLEKAIISLAKEEGIDIDNISNEINEKYGSKLPNLPLEDMIDKSNIHGWLQGKITSSEGRIAAWTTRLLNTNENTSSKMENIYIKQGIKAAREVKDNGGVASTAPEIYNNINDYLLDGMPCDRVNEIITTSDEKLQWIRRICVHEVIWSQEGEDVNYFYMLRDLWIKAFVTELNNKFHYIETEDGVKTIELV